MSRTHPKVSLREYPHDLAHSWRLTPSVSPRRRSVRIREDKARAAERSAAHA